MATKKETREKKKARKGLTLAYTLTGIAILVVVIYMTFWFNFEFPKTFHIFGR